MPLNPKPLNPKPPGSLTYQLRPGGGKALGAFADLREKRRSWDGGRENGGEVEVVGGIGTRSISKSRRRSSSGGGGGGSAVAAIRGGGRVAG